MEIAVEAGLRSLRQNAAALLGELASADSGAWAISIAEVEASSRSLLDKWRHLDPNSPFGEVADEAVELVSEVAVAFETGLVPPAIVRQQAEWIRARGSRLIANSLRATRSRMGNMSLRETARRSGIAPGHLSELEDGRGNLPTRVTAQRLDNALGTDFVGILGRVRGALPRALRRRRLPTAGVAAMPSTGSLDPRLDALISRMAGDDRLVQMMEDLLSLSAGARRGIAQMIRALVADETQSRGKT